MLSVGHSGRVMRSVRLSSAAVSIVVRRSSTSDRLDDPLHLKVFDSVAVSVIKASTNPVVAAVSSDRPEGVVIT